MTERAAIGTLWRRRRDKTTWRIVQSHRRDRIAELIPDGPAPLQSAHKHKAFVSFTDLRQKFEEA